MKLYLHWMSRLKILLGAVTNNRTNSARWLQWFSLNALPETVNLGFPVTYLPMYVNISVTDYNREVLLFLPSCEGSNRRILPEAPNWAFICCLEENIWCTPTYRCWSGGPRAAAFQAGFERLDYQFVGKLGDRQGCELFGRALAIRDRQLQNTEELMHGVSHTLAAWKMRAGGSDIESCHFLLIIEQETQKKAHHEAAMPERPHGHVFNPIARIRSWHKRTHSRIVALHTSYRLHANAPDPHDQRFRYRRTTHLNHLPQPVGEH